MEQITEQIKKLENSIKIYPQNLANYFELGSIYVKIKRIAHFLFRTRAKSSVEQMINLNDGIMPIRSP